MLFSAPLLSGEGGIKEGVCIPLGGNIPLRGNSVSILFVSSERVGII